MKLKDLKELELIKGEISSQDKIDIVGTTSTGGEMLNLAENKLFLWKFKQEDIDDFIGIYSLLREDKISEKTRQRIYGRVKEKSREMMNEGVCPVESLLYASKSINNFINNDRTLINYISMVIYEMIFLYKDRVHRTLNHIISNWHWIPQLKIAIATLGKVKDVNLLTNCYYRFSNDNNLRVHVFKALVDSGQSEVVDYILEMLSTIDESSMCDKEISKYFKEQFRGVFNDEALKRAYELLKNRNITSFARKTITYICGRDTAHLCNLNSRNLGDLIVKAKALKDSDKGVKEFRSLLANKATRKSAIVALRFSGNKQMGDLIFSIINNEKCSELELKEAIISLGILKYNKAIDKIRTLHKLKEYRVYCNAYDILLGDVSPCNELSRELFMEEYTGYNESSKAINQCINCCQELKESINSTFANIMENSDDRTQIKTLNILKEVLKKCLNKNIEEEWYKLMGYYNNDIMVSENVQIGILELLESVIENKNAHSYERFLFYILRDERFSLNVQMKAQNILKAFEVKAPGTI